MTTKKLLQSAFLMIGLLLTTTVVLADGPGIGGPGGGGVPATDGPPTTSGAGAPIDGGITLLLSLIHISEPTRPY